MNKSIFTEVIESGIPFDNHCSDLYIPVNEKTREILSRHPESGPVSTFHNQTSPLKELWYDLTFQYGAYWASKTGESYIDSWELKLRPDSSYGLSYPYEFVYLGENCIIEKFPFSPYIAKFNGYSCYISNSENQYSFYVIKNNETLYQAKDFKTLQVAYIAFVYWVHNHK